MYKHVNTCALSNSAAFQANSKSFKEAVQFLAASDNRLGEFHKYTKDELHALVSLYSKLCADMFKDCLLSVLHNFHESAMKALFCMDTNTSENLIARECVNELIFKEMSDEIKDIESAYIKELADCRGFDYRYCSIVDDEYDSYAKDAVVSINNELRRAA